MPSTITHAYIGIDTLKKLNKNPQKIITDRINNFKVYCQSMDVLYFYHIFLLKRNTIQEMGHKFHNENIYKTFELLINDNKINKDKELFTFIAGLIIHYKADCIMHPFINYLAYNKKELLKTDKHFEIETYIDNYYINKNYSKNYFKINSSKFVFNYKNEEIIEKEIDKLFKNIWNKDNMGKKYYRALKEMHFVFKNIRYDKYGIKKGIYQLIDLNPFNIRRCKYLSYHFKLNNDNYYLNINHKKWFNDKEYTKSFLDLYKDVTIESSFIINELYEYIFNNKNINLKELIGNNSYSTGLKIESFI